jgi:hypothetical protein
LRVSKKLLALNVALVGVAITLAVWLGRDLAASRSLPAAPAARKPGGSAATEDAAPESTAQERLTSYNTIVAKYLFNPSRTEGGVEMVSKPAVPLPPKPMMIGVVADEKGGRVYLEDPTTKRVLSYQVGDSVAGGRLEKIADDRILISRVDGPMEVTLRDPAKPRPAPPPPTPPQPGAQPGAPVPPPGAPGPRVEGQPPVPGRPPIPPRSLRRVPVEQQPSSEQ